jgi:hypothetical protein
MVNVRHMTLMFVMVLSAYPLNQLTCVLQQNESCASIAAFNGLKVVDLDEFNKETW